MSIVADLEGKTDLKIRVLEVIDELRTKRADKQVHHHLCYYFNHSMCFIVILIFLFC